MKDLTIAIIDDDLVDRLVCKKLIEMVAPYIRTMEFPNAMDALHYFSENAKDENKLPDIVLLDIRMPLMDGWDYLEHYSKIADEISKQPRHYIYTSSIDPYDLNSQNNNVYGNYTKPFDQRSLLEIIEQNIPEE